MTSSALARDLPQLHTGAPERVARSCRSCAWRYRRGGWLAAAGFRELVRAVRCGSPQPPWQSSTPGSEQHPGFEVHFAQTEEAAPVTTLRYDEDPPTGAYLTDQPLDLTPPLESRAQQILENIVELWKGARSPAAPKSGTSGTGNSPAAGP